MLFEQSSEISFIYLSSMRQKEKSNKTPTNMPVKEFYQKIAKQIIFTLLHKFQKQFMFMLTVFYKRSSNNDEFTSALMI